MNVFFFLCVPPRMPSARPGAQHWTNAAVAAWLLDYYFALHSPGLLSWPCLKKYAF